MAFHMKLMSGEMFEEDPDSLSKEATKLKSETPVEGDSETEFSFVAKMSIDPFEDPSTYFADVETQLIAKRL